MADFLEADLSPRESTHIERTSKVTRPTNQHQKNPQ
jgi:hypothetical protein